MEVDEVERAWTCCGQDPKVIALREQRIKCRQGPQIPMIAGGDISLCADARFQRSREKSVARFRCNGPRSNICGAKRPELPKRLVIKVPTRLFGRDRPRKPPACRVS